MKLSEKILIFSSVVVLGVLTYTAEHSRSANGPLRAFRRVSKMGPVPDVVNASADEKYTIRIARAS